MVLAVVDIVEEVLLAPAGVADIVEDVVGLFLDIIAVGAVVDMLEVLLDSIGLDDGDVDVDGDGGDFVDDVNVDAVVDDVVDGQEV